MYDFQKTVLIQAKPTMFNLVSRYVLLGFSVIALAGLLLLNPSLFLIPFVVLAALFWFVWRHSSLEYEYFYFDGELTIDKIRDKRRRKSVKSLKMEEILEIVPASDPRLYNIYKEPQIKTLDVSSHTEGAACYVIIANQAGNKTCITFEPDNEMLNAICIKYSSKVKR